MDVPCRLIIRRSVIPIFFKIFSLRQGWQTCLRARVSKLLKILGEFISRVKTGVSQDHSADDSCDVLFTFNPLTSNDPYSGRTAPLTSKRYILYIYSTNTVTEYFKHGIYSPFFSLQNAVCFIILTYLVPVLFTFYIQGVLKFKKIIPVPKG